MEPDMIRLCKVVLMVFISCHFAGCLFWLVKSLSNLPEEVNDFLDEHRFKGAKDKQQRGGWFCHSKLPEDYPECDTSAVKDVYILCFYYAMTTLTTVGYGDIGGENSMERIYCAMLQIVGTVVFATIMNQLSMVLDNMNHHAREKEFRQTKWGQFLRHHYVDPPLVKKILAWAGFQYDNDVNWNEGKEIMQLLPRSMRSALALDLHERMLSTVPVFFRSGSEFLAEVALSLVPERYNAGEQVATVGEVTEALHPTTHISHPTPHTNVLGTGDGSDASSLLWLLRHAGARWTPHYRYRIPEFLDASLSPVVPDLVWYVCTV